MKTLKDLSVGEFGIVKKIETKGALKIKLMDMGITKNVEVFVRKIAPLGDPIELTLRGYELSIRKSDAQFILLED